MGQKCHSNEGTLAKITPKRNYVYACAHTLSTPKQQSQQKSLMSLHIFYRRRKEEKTPTATEYLGSTQIFSKGAKITVKKMQREYFLLYFCGISCLGLDIFSTLLTLYNMP